MRNFRRKRFYKKKPFFRKKRYFKRRRGGSKKWRVSRQRNLIASNSQLVTFRFSKSVQLNPANGNSVVFTTFRANDIYFPDGNPNPPKGVGQWELFYNHYIVIGSKIRCYFNSGGSTTSVSGGMVGIVLTDSAAPAYINGDDILQEPRARWKVIGNQTGEGTTSVSRGFSPKKFWTVNNLMDNQEHYGNVCGVNPPEIAFYQVFFAPHAVSGGTGGPWVTVLIDYKVMFTGPRRVAP